MIDVCKAEREIMEKARLEGRLEGRREGSEKARLETLCTVVKNAMESFHLSMDEAMNGLKVPKEDQAILVKMM